MAMLKDRMTTRKRETFLNVTLLNKLYPISSDAAKSFLKETSFEKPTQSMFNHISYYLLSIIDSKVSASLPWPLYDTTTDKQFRKELSIIISRYSSDGLLAPVMSSYFVNPGCFKVVNLMFQLSKLAVQRSVLSSMKTESQKKLYDSMTEKYESRNMDGFINLLEGQRESMRNKFSQYLCKRKAMEKIADLFKERILSKEEKLLSHNAQGYIDNLVEKYLKENKVNERVKAQLLQVKDVNVKSEIFELWLEQLDREINELESEWETRMTPFLKLCVEAQKNTETLISRETGAIDKNSFLIEYNPKTDYICTNDLQSVVNAEQKYVLKNIIRNDRLNFPNLIRGFLISICYIFKNAEIDEDIYEFNKYIDVGSKRYKEFISSMKSLVDRVDLADSKLQMTPSIMISSESLMTDYGIPPLPDLSDIKMNVEFHPQTPFDAFTPNLRTYKFNLRRNAASSFIRPFPKTTLVTPYHCGLDNGVNSLEHLDHTKNIHNLSVIPLTRANETIAGSSSGFTRDQISRLLSTKKMSTTKKLHHKKKRSESKKELLFNESNLSNESFMLIRSHSSPNLCENKGRRFGVSRERKLSMMKEANPSLLEMSGITLMDKYSNRSTPEGVVNLESTRKHVDTSSLPSLTVTAASPMEIPHRQSAEILTEEQTKIVTPKTNANLVTRTSSLEKIINRFKKVRGVRTCESAKVEEERIEIKTIVQEMENVNVDVIAANRILLPDLISPSCNLMTPRLQRNDQLFYDSDDDLPRMPRESLGTALGVDITFLDQFDLVD